MYLNTARFNARTDINNSTINLEEQDRKKWDQNMIQKGVQYLDSAAKYEKINPYLILATISAHHCIAKDFESTNWEEIVRLYDQLIILEDSPIIRLNRSVALSKLKGNNAAILELKELSNNTDIGTHYLFPFYFG